MAGQSSEEGAARLRDCDAEIHPTQAESNQQHIHSTTTRPSLTKTMADAYNDELFNPAFTVTSGLPFRSAPSTTTSPNQPDLFPQHPQAANRKLMKRSQERSPLRQGSPLAPGVDSSSSQPSNSMDLRGKTRVHQHKETREKTRATPPYPQMLDLSQATPKTILPRDAKLFYDELDQSPSIPLFSSLAEGTGHPCETSMDPLQQVSGCPVDPFKTISQHADIKLKAQKVREQSRRPYADRVKDPEDFASVWENTLVPLLALILPRKLENEFSADVYTIPEIDPNPGRRIINIMGALELTLGEQQSVRAKISSVLPEPFRSTQLNFYKGKVERAGWLGSSEDDPDENCEPKNTIFQDQPTLGISIGPELVDDATSFGGIIEIGGATFGTSAYHSFATAITTSKRKNISVYHPASRDHSHSKDTIIGRNKPGPYRIGTLWSWSGPDKTRKSLTFKNVPIPEEFKAIEMDWVLIRMISEGINALPTPNSQDMKVRATVEAFSGVFGNSEVYSVARTSGFSLGFTSDVPGLHLFGPRRFRREWSVRQYTPLSQDEEDAAMAYKWQTKKEWVTSGIGLPGDSGAWLIDRETNAVIGHIWARNRDYGSEDMQRLALFTPIVDLFADIEDEEQFKPTMPKYTAEQKAVKAKYFRNAVTSFTNIQDSPWDLWSSSLNTNSRKRRIDVISTKFDCGTPGTWAEAMTKANKGDVIAEVEESRSLASLRSPSTIRPSVLGNLGNDRLRTDLSGVNASTGQSSVRNLMSTPYLLPSALEDHEPDRESPFPSLPSLISDNHTSLRSAVADHDTPPQTPCPAIARLANVEISEGVDDEDLQPVRAMARKPKTVRRMRGDRELHNTVLLG